MNDFVRPYTTQFRPEPEDRVGFRDLLEPAFRQENDMTNLLAMIERNRGLPEFDPAFDLLEVGPASPLWNDFSGQLAQARSLPEFRALEIRIAQENKDRQLLASQGWRGITAGMMAGIISPTILIPLVGPARGVKGVAQAVGLAAAAATAQEVPMMLNQLTRTDRESTVSIAAGTVLGGLLGTAAVMLRGADFDRVARELELDADPPQRAVVRGESNSIEVVGEPAAGLEIDLPPPREIAIRQADAETSTPALREAAEDAGAPPSVRDAILEGPAPVRASFDEGTPATVQVFYVDKKTGWAVGRFDAEGNQIGEVQNLYLKKDAIAAATQLEDRVPLQIFNRYGEVMETRAAREAVEEAPEETAEALGQGIGAASRSEPFTPTIIDIAPDGTVTETPLTAPGTSIGKMADATFLGSIAARTSPVLRSINQWDQPFYSQTIANNMMKLSDSGVAMQGNKVGIATASQGTVEHRVGYYQGLLGAFLRNQHEQYIEYIFGKTANIAQRRAVGFMMETGRAPKGKLSFDDFKAQVTDVMNKRDKSDIPQVAAAASGGRELLDFVHKAAIEASDEQGGKRLYEFFDPNDPEMSYFPHVFSPEKVAQLSQSFIRELAEHYEAKLRTSFERRVTKELAKLEDDDQIAQILRMTREEAQRAYDEAGEALKSMRDPSSMSENVDRIDALRFQVKAVRERRFEELEAKNNPGEDSIQSKANMKQAKEDTADEVEELQLQIARLEDALPPEVMQTKIKAAQLRKYRRVLNQSIGRLEQKKAELFDRIEKNEDMNLQAFDRVLRAHNRFLREMDKMDDAALDASYKRLNSLLEAAVKDAQRAQKVEDKIWKEGTLNEFAAAQEAFAPIGEKILKRIENLENSRAANRDRLREEIKARLQNSIEYVNNVNSKRSERNAVLRQRADELRPEDVETRIKALRETRESRLEALDERLRGAGAVDVNVRAGRFDFSGVARDAATDLYNKIVGNFTRIAQIDTMAQLRSPMKRRMLDLPYDVKRKYLELDSEKVMARYVQTMGSDIELYRATGTVDGSAGIDVINRVFNAQRERLFEATKDSRGRTMTEKRREKELAQLEKAMERRKNEYAAMVERIRGIRGMPKDPHSIPYRLGRLFLNWNTSTMMGTAAITSIPDAARAVMAHGLMKTFRSSWAPFIGGLVSESQKGVNKEVIKQLRLLGIGLDTYTQNRARGAYDISGTPFGRQTSIERFFEFTAAKTPQVALFGPWTDAMKLMTGAATMSRILNAVEDMHTGKISKGDIEYLATASIDPLMARRIHDQMQRFGTRYKDTNIPNVEKWDDYAAMRAFHAAMSREDARLVITPGLEKPLWMDASMLGRLVGQFRSFTMASNTKILVSGLQSRNMALAHTMQGTVFSLALGAVSYYLWAMTTSERAREEMRNATWEQWLDQAIYRSGLLGAFSEIQNIGSEIPATQDYVSFAGSDLAGRRANSVMGAVLGPSFGKAEDIANLLVQIDDPTQSTTAQARKLMVWQNVFYLREGFNQIEQGVNSVLGLPERRQ